jgi:hypothetical protein
MQDGQFRIQKRSDIQARWDGNNEPPLRSALNLTHGIMRCAAGKLAEYFINPIHILVYVETFSCQHNPSPSFWLLAE